MRPTANTPEAWNNLLGKYGEVVTFLGAESPDYWGSGQWEWESTILPALQPLGAGARLLEWGAGSGRLTKAVLATLEGLGELYAYDPSGAARELWLQHFPEGIIVGTEELHRLPRDFTHLFCIFVMHHMSYDDLWELFGFTETHLAPGGILTFDYISITSPIAEGFLRRKETSEWPSYMWHPGQIEALLRFRAPSLEWQRTVDRPRELQVWRKRHD